MRFHIDEPTEASIVRPALCIRGWCFDDGGLPIKGIRARAGRRVFPGTHGGHRPDVRAALDGAACSEWSGFAVDVELAAGSNRFSLEAEAGDKGWVEFHRMELACPWTASLGHAFRMALFLPQAFFGRQNALRSLPRWEQEAVIVGFQRKAGHSLTTIPHHPARAVALENFPKPRIPPARLPKVTIVTPSFQQSGFIEAAIRSVLGQEGVRLDYIVRDGGSIDGTVEILRRYSDRLKGWASEPDKGQADAVNRGMAMADCGPDDLMAYLNSDDMLMPGAVRHVAEYFARHPGVEAVYGHRVLIDEAGFETGRWLTPRRSSHDLRLHDFVPQETLFWRKRLWDRAGGLDPDFHYSADWDLILRFAESGAVIHRLPWFLGMFRRHPAQKTATMADRVGIPEDIRLRRRSLGRDPSPEEIGANMRSARLDSALLAILWQRGWRL